MRSTTAPTGTEADYARLPDDPRELRSFEAFLEQARWIADWQWRRGQTFEAKAGPILGFVGIILSLQIAILRSVITVPKTGFAWTTAILFTISALGLVISALACLMVLKPRKYQNAKIDQIREQWTQYVAHGHLSSEGVLFVFADQLLRGTGQREPVKGLRDDADTRSTWMTVAMWALFASIATIAVIVGVVAFHEATT